MVRIFGAAITTAAILGAIALSRAADAQMPPTPTPAAAATISPPTNLTPGTRQPPFDPVTGCGHPAMARVEGGQETGLGTGDTMLRVSLPPGGPYGTLPNGPVGAELGLRICHIPTNSLIIISAVTGREISRVVTDPVGHAILDQIAASARITAASSPSAGDRESPAQAVSPLRPPTTGNAGLRKIASWTPR
jgi:hypothetical protein